jgi:hypothetical protein
MATLWTFGDSFTESFLPPENCNVIHWRHHYIEWKGYVPKVYGEFLSERLDMKLMNYGMGSWDNYSIFESFCMVVNKIKKDDLIIFGWSDPVRFRLTDFRGNWHYFTANHNSTEIPAQYMDVDSIQKILANRGNKRYSDEVNTWINLINHTLKNNCVIHWTPFVNNIQAAFLSGFERVSEETNGEVNDGHFSENGQEELSKVLESKINRIRNRDII